MARFSQLAGITARRAHQAVASCAGSLLSQSLSCHQPNWAFQRTPTPSVLVPYAPAVLRRRLPWALGLLECPVFIGLVGRLSFGSRAHHRGVRSA